MWSESAIKFSKIVSLKHLKKSMFKRIVKGKTTVNERLSQMIRGKEAEYEATIK